MVAYCIAQNSVCRGPSLKYAINIKEVSTFILIERMQHSVSTNVSFDCFEF